MQNHRQKNNCRQRISRAAAERAGQLLSQEIDIRLGHNLQGSGIPETMYSDFKIPVMGTDDNRHTPHGSLQHIMTADIFQTADSAFQ